MLSPLYMAEISPPEMRGSLLALEQFSIVLGCVVGFWTGFSTRNGEPVAALSRNLARLNYGFVVLCCSCRESVLANTAGTTAHSWDPSRFGGVRVTCFSASACPSGPKRRSSCVARQIASSPRL